MLFLFVFLQKCDAFVVSLLEFPQVLRHAEEVGEELDKADQAQDDGNNDNPDQFLLFALIIGIYMEARSPVVRQRDLEEAPRDKVVLLLEVPLVALITDVYTRRHVVVERPAERKGFCRA